MAKLCGRMQSLRQGQRAQRWPSDGARARFFGDISIYSKDRIVSKYDAHMPVDTKRVNKTFRSYISDLGLGHFPISSMAKEAKTGPRVN